ncbi:MULTISPECIES: hypothetical protein [unclassified Bradyrhizobium]|uniref:hypothetical protein n=1 Tax=unclassified Bradyrhizobium TaxID=2631580 RepID=UPI0018DCDCDC|nr:MULTISPECIES: hypothetical protein [unclassified Bradyrhizobium]MCP3466572.1 hypothetical protein [Bradyrhizobium sp. CCGUVB23]
MSQRTQPGTAPRDRILEAARRELTEFERREIEFRKKDREERAAELRLPLKEIKVH